MSEEAETETVTRPVSVIANPLAGKKTTKRLLKLCKRAAKSKGLRRGVKEVVKAIRKKEKGLCIIAGDISPIDVITHIPILCEESDIPYIYVPSREELGTAGGTKRPTSCIFLPTKLASEYQEEFDAACEEVKANAATF
eukprot:tig00001085_g6943.t1